MQILEREKWKILSKKIKMIKNDERPEYNFWKLTKVGCHADNGSKDGVKEDNRLIDGENEESFAGSPTQGTKGTANAIRGGGENGRRASK